MSSFLEKVKSGYTHFDNIIFFMMTDGVITHSEFIFMMYVLMLNKFRKHKTSRNQLEKVLRMKRETISQIIKSLELKKLIEIETIDKFIIIHSNIEIERTATVTIKTQEEQTQEFDKYDPDAQTDLPPRGASKPTTPAPQTDRSPAPLGGNIELRYINKIENKDITREFALAGGVEVATTEKEQKEQRKKVKAAYQEAFENRYKVSPFIDNPKSHSLIKNLVKQVGHDTAIKLCYEYLKSNDSYAVKERHPLSLLIQNPTKFIVDNKIGRVTSSDQKHIDLKEANDRSYKEWLASKGELN